jgi:hypothetical protein
VLTSVLFSLSMTVYMCMCVRVLGSTECSFVVHRECYTLGATCAEVGAAHHTRPLTFLAADETERERWLANLVALRDSVAASPAAPTTPKA